MKTAQIFKQYIWLADTIRRAGRITLNELSERWEKSGISDGISLSRSTFNRHRESIEEMFDLCIGCKHIGKNYYYYIENQEVLDNDNLQHWMLDSLSIGNLLMESSSLKDRIVLENIPAGKLFLQPIISAMKLSRKLEITYRKFGQAQGYTITVEPYAIKVFKHRWYLLAKNYKRPHPAVYALDRMMAVQETDESFNYPDDFDTELFFKEYYGVLCNTDSKAERIVVRAYPPFTHYLRTLPLHHSQRELTTTPEYADFEFCLHPTFDFLQELFSQMHEVEVLEPEHLRQEMKERLMKTMERYAEPKTNEP